MENDKLIESSDSRCVMVLQFSKLMSFHRRLYKTRHSPNVTDLNFLPYVVTTQKVELLCWKRTCYHLFKGDGLLKNLKSSCIFVDGKILITPL